MTSTNSTGPADVTPVELIVGLGNPGPDYAQTRHNAGVWFVERLAEQAGAGFRSEKKFFGRLASVSIAGREVRLLLPDTWMNESGKSVGAVAGFFKLPPQHLLIVHDEIDFPCGRIRFKQGGGLAGHNGLKDIARSLAGSTDFNRLRIGVGHPGDRGRVTGHVLGRVSATDRQMIDTCIDLALESLPLAVSGDWQRAIQELHNTAQPCDEQDGGAGDGSQGRKGED